jgi:hypothetical protein
MKIRMLNSLVPAAVLAIAFAGCGGDDDKPDINQVKEDFSHPSGSVSDKQAIVGVASEREASSPALALAAGGIPGFGLTSAKQRGFATLAPIRTYAPALNSLREAVRQRGLNRQGLSVAQFGGGAGNCDDSAEAKAAFEDLQKDIVAQAQSGSTEISGSASFEVDLASCSQGEMTGNMAVSINLHAEQTGANSGAFTYNVTMGFDKVCETKDKKTCIDGTFVLEASISTTGQNAGKLEYVQAWELSASWNEEGRAITADTKGGIRLAYEGTNSNGSGQLQYLFYVKDSTGREVSFVLEITANSQGEATLKYKGSDGELTCTQKADGSGSCTGTGGAAINWTAGDLDAAVEAQAG